MNEYYIDKIKNFKRREHMKTLHAYRGFIAVGAVGYTPGIIMILFDVLIGVFDDWGNTSIVDIVMSFLFILLGTLIGIVIYCTHSIRYGNGRVVIRRYSKELVDGRPVGKWKIREDEFSLKEIDVYGYSNRRLGGYGDVEYHINSGARWGIDEVFFQLKDKKRIGYVGGYYTRKAANEFFRYIFEETGKEFQKSKPV